MFEKSEYDRSVNVFSKEGELLQIEYANKAVNQGWTTLGIQTTTGIVIASEKKIQSRLQVPSSIEKISKINENTIVGYSGLLSDARSLIDHARVEAANHWFVYNEDIPMESLCISVCELSMTFADRKREKRDDEEEKRKISRPFGCALLLAGLDRNNKPQLYKTDPSGNYCRYKACCMGEGGDNGMITLTENYDENMSLENAINLAGKVIKENMGQKINKYNVEISYISCSDKKITNLTPEQIEVLIPKFV